MIPHFVTAPFLWAKLHNNVFILDVNDYIILISMLLVFY